jgi:hypothetical protein
VSTTNGGKQQKIKVKLLIDELNSGNQSKISASIKALQANGDISILEPMVRLLSSDISEKIKSEIIEFLSSLKDTDSVDEIMRILKDSVNIQIRGKVLATIWNSPLNYSYYLADFVEIAVEGDFMEALECLTIIENLEGPFEERYVLESQLHLQDYVKDTNPKDPKKAQIMSEIAVLIKDFSNMDEDDEIEFFNDED